MSKYLSIRQIRLTNELTQKEMAEILGIEHATYQRKETGKSSWTLDDVVAIKKNFNINIDDLAETQVQ